MQFFVFISILEIGFKLSTNTACSTDGINKYISGLQKDVPSQEDCSLECERYNWCRGYRISGKDDSLSCRLLTNEIVSLSDGWEYLDEGNWAEPDKWKETHNAIVDPLPLDMCYEKFFVGKKAAIHCFDIVIYT